MTITNEKIPIIEIKNLSKLFVKKLDIVSKVVRSMGADIQEEKVQALDEVNLKIFKGEVVGLVGETGCGKSTLGRIVAGILKPSEGSVSFYGQDLSTKKNKELKKIMLKIQMIFQDPFASLNPRMRVCDIIGEAPRVHGLVSPRELDTYLDELMQQCGLDPFYKPRYPHQLSGGQRQRIAIARALAVKPEFIVCDEIVSALDVSIQAQILNMFMDHRKKYGFTSLFISHDLGVVEHVSDRVAIMYLGRIFEQAKTEKLFAEPLHPYTKALLEEVPKISKRRINFVPIKGEIPSPINPPAGCHFHPRCPDTITNCKHERPALRKIDTDHFVACHLF